MPKNTKFGSSSRARLTSGTHWLPYPTYDRWNESLSLYQRDESNDGLFTDMKDTTILSDETWTHLPSSRKEDAPGSSDAALDTQGEDSEHAPVLLVARLIDGSDDEEERATTSSAIPLAWGSSVPATPSSLNVVSDNATSTQAVPSSPRRTPEVWEDKQLRFVQQLRLGYLNSRNQPHLIFQKYQRKYPASQRKLQSLRKKLAEYDKEYGAPMTIDGRSGRTMAMVDADDTEEAEDSEEEDSGYKGNYIDHTELDGEEEQYLDGVDQGGN